MIETEKSSKIVMTNRGGKKGSFNYKLVMSGRPSFPPLSFNTCSTSSIGRSTSASMYHWPNDSPDQ